MKRIEVALAATSLAVVAGFIGGPILASAMEGDKTVVRCAGQGQVQEGQGYISGAEDASRTYDLDISRSQAFDLGSDLDKRARGPYPNEWVWVGAAADGSLVRLELGRCPADLPQPIPIGSTAP